MITLMSAIEQASLLYTKCYCEENIYHLIKSLSNVSELDKTYAIFISNPTRSIPIWCQKSSLDGQPVIWDYHVICLAKSKEWLVLDFDTTLPNPVSFTDYLSKAIRPHIQLPSQLKRSYRVISGPDYIEHFASDRSHMKKNGAWLSQPPNRPAIKSATETNNLDRFIDMGDQTFEKMKDYILADPTCEHTFDFGGNNISSHDESVVPSIKRRKCHSPHRSPKSLKDDVISLDTFELYRSNPWVCLYPDSKDHDSGHDEPDHPKVVSRRTDEAVHSGHERSYPPVHARSLVDFINTGSLQDELVKFESVDLSPFKNTVHARDVVWKAASTKLVIPDDAIGVSELTQEELSACSTLRFMPEVYLKIKKLILLASFRIGPFRKRDAQNWFRIDVNKISAIYEWFCSLGWIPQTHDEWTAFLEKYKEPF